jgi:hypothetical protein
MNISEIGEELGADGHQLIRDVCEVAWTRLPGSEGEQKAQEFLRGKLEEYGADEVDVRQYKVYSKFFLWWPRISIIFFYISMAFYFFVPVVAFAFALLATVNVLLKFFSFTFLDVFFPAKPSSNVVGKLHASELGASGKPKRVVIIGGHTDSNYEYPIGGGMGMIKYVAPVFVMIGVWLLGTFILFILSLFGNPYGLFWTWFFIIVVICIPYASWIGWGLVRNLPVAGANDNLSGVVVAVETLKYFAQHPEDRPANVDLWAVCFGSEEGGMIGSKTMAKDVRKMLDAKDFPGESVWVVNFDTVGANGPLHIATKEPMYRVGAYDPVVYTALDAAATQAGVDHFLKSLSAGGTDSAPFGRQAIPAAGVLCFGDGTSPPNWHTRNDVPDNIDPRGLANCIKMAIQFVKDADNELSN